MYDACLLLIYPTYILSPSESRITLQTEILEPEKYICVICYFPVLIVYWQKRSADESIELAHVLLMAGRQ
jgi:hypothetical protein